jgi:hypothetical protein
VEEKGEASWLSPLPAAAAAAAGRGCRGGAGEECWLTVVAAGSMTALLLLGEEEGAFSSFRSRRFAGRGSDWTSPGCSAKYCSSCSRDHTTLVERSWIQRFTTRSLLPLLLLPLLLLFPNAEAAPAEASALLLLLLLLAFPKMAKPPLKRYARNGM